MALLTLGSTAQTSLSAIIRHSSSPAFTAADGALVRAGIKDDLGNLHPIWPDALRDGLLYIPNRGVLQMLDGDYVAFDSTGWPILISAYAIANGPWVHS